MTHFIIAWAVTFAAFIIIDAIWLGLVANSFYQSRIGALMREQVWFGVAGAFYVLYTVAVLILVVLPAHKSGSMTQALMTGALLGLCAYGTYDVTNLATLRGWPVSVAIVDMVWGTLLTATIAAVGYQTMLWLRPL